VQSTDFFRIMPENREIITGMRYAIAKLVPDKKKFKEIWFTEKICE